MVYFTGFTVRKKWGKNSVIAIKLAIDNCTLFRLKNLPIMLISASEAMHY